MPGPAAFVALRPPPGYHSQLAASARIFLAEPFRIGVTWTP
jgi:hypothetical protein